MKQKRFYRKGMIIGTTLVMLVLTLIPGMSGALESAETNNSITRDLPEGNWNIEYVWSYPTTYPNANTITIQDSYAYITSHTERQYVCPPYHGALDIFKINTNPPYLVGSLSGSYDIYEPLDITVDNDYVYVSDYKECGWGFPEEPGSYIDEIDISNPQHPGMHTRTFHGNNVDHNVAIVAQQGYLYVLKAGSLEVYSIPEPYFPLVTLSLPFCYITDLFIKDNYAFLLGDVFQVHPPRWIPTLEIIDISNPEEPIHISDITVASSSCLSVGCTKVCAMDIQRYYSQQRYNRYVYLTTDYGLQIIDITNPEHPTYKTNYSMPYPSNYVCVEGNYAYISSGPSGITVLDVSSPAYPIPAGFYITDVNTVSLGVQKGIIYVADELSGLLILRFTGESIPPLSRPEGPLHGEVGVSYEFSTNIRSFSFREDQVYLLWSWGDTTYSEWLGPYPSNNLPPAVHAWSEPGVYPVRVKLKDSLGRESRWSPPLFISID
ncbi:MAG: hypothetical protein V1726_03845 [Methanobacteriota archaeon]